MPKPKPHFPKVCGACHGDFVTHKPKATRCPQCISEGRRATYRSCFECKSKFIVTDDSHINCSKCVDELGLEDQSELTPEQRERYLEQERIDTFIRRRDQQLEWLTQHTDRHARDRAYREKQQQQTKTGERSPDRPEKPNENNGSPSNQQPFDLVKEAARETAARAADRCEKPNQNNDSPSNQQSFDPVKEAEDINQPQQYDLTTLGLI